MKLDLLLAIFVTFIRVNSRCKIGQQKKAQTSTWCRCMGWASLL